jgi:hypothetical protein
VILNGLFSLASPFPVCSGEHFYELAMYCARVYQIWTNTNLSIGVAGRGGFGADVRCGNGSHTNCACRRSLGIQPKDNDTTRLGVQCQLCGTPSWDCAVYGCGSIGSLARS